MFSLTKPAPATPAVQQPDSLERDLIAMRAFGDPRLGVYSGGWHCNIEMHVASVGATFIIRSDFGLPTPHAATRQCQERIDKALRAGAGAKP